MIVLYHSIPMNRYLTTRNIAVTGAVTICAVMLFLIFNPSGENGEKAGRPRPGGLSAGSGPPVPVQEMPDGTHRPLTLRIPAVGRVSGARWIPGHQFWNINQRPGNDGPLITLPLDVLVDGDGNFLAARRNGTRFDTRMPDTSMHRLLQYAIYYEYQERRRLAQQQQGVLGPDLPEVSRVSPAKVPWDDPGLGDAVKKLMNLGFDGFTNDKELEQAPQRFEETYLFLEVQFEGEAAPRHMAIRRTTEGRVWVNQWGARTYPALPEPYICNTNSNGASVSYLIVERRPAGPEFYSGLHRLYLTEPWDGPSPWPEERLDPNVGHDRINEFFFPDEAPYGQMPDLLKWDLPPTSDVGKPFEERAQKNKAARLAQETGGNGGSGR